jgi:hypothetical protein
MLVILSNWFCLTAASIIRAIALMMKAAGISETSVNIYQNTWRNIPEDSHIQSFNWVVLL